MPTHVALLYSIVLAPGRRVVMADLRALAADLGLTRPRTVVATGNLVFEADAGPRDLEALLEPAFEERFGKHIDIIVREGAAWPRLLAGNPFPEAAKREPSRVAARVMRAPAPRGVLRRPRALPRGGRAPRARRRRPLGPLPARPGHLPPRRRDDACPRRRRRHLAQLEHASPHRRPARELASSFTKLRLRPKRVFSSATKTACSSAPCRPAIRATSSAASA